MLKILKIRFNEIDLLNVHWLLGFAIFWYWLSDNLRETTKSETTAELFLLQKTEGEQFTGVGDRGSPFGDLGGKISSHNERGERWTLPRKRKLDHSQSLFYFVNLTAKQTWWERSHFLETFWAVLSSSDSVHYKHSWSQLPARIIAYNDSGWYLIAVPRHASHNCLLTLANCPVLPQADTN